MPDSLTLKGSNRTITEFFEYCINSILYQRGIYPEEDFSRVKKYDLFLMKTTDDELKSYIRKILVQVHKWMSGGKCNKVVICIIDKENGVVVERWAFDIIKLSEANEKETENTNSNANASDTLESLSAVNEETQQQIRALIRQITASVTFLPELVGEGNYTFNVLAYTDAFAKVPLEWGDSNSKEITDGEVLTLKSFSTSDHKVGAEVSYKY